MSDKDIEVSSPVAKYFFEQCAGSCNGQMASVPNNPVLHGLCLAHKADSKDSFSKFLREVADRLDEGNNAF